ncbi:MAG TPA: site-specific integrase [Solirubrobacteraceae bacterium]|jgi:integrase|nr:site-specific integrase [Solirubrobacteraceae bacterium]
MTRRQNGEVIVRPGKRGVGFQLRFYAYGRREHITHNSRHGWTIERAELELSHIIADVERGIWQPHVSQSAPEPPNDPTLREFASEWLEARRPELRESTYLDYRWQLTDHLLPFFADHRLSQITVKEVDRYRAIKVREAALSPNSINKTLTRLGQILEVALEYGLVDVNAARVGGRRRRVRAVKPPQTYLDRAEHIVALLDAARELEAEARSDRKWGRLAFLSVLTFAGLRISEALALRIRDVDLAAGRLRVVDAKSPAGVRYVELLPIVREDLTAHKATLTDTAVDALMFPTHSGGRQGKDNARNRVFAPAVKRANERLAAGGLTPLPEGLTPHSLRRTCCSLRIAFGEDLAYVAEQLGHADTSTTHRIYTRVMRLDAATREQLRRLVSGAEWVQTGANDARESPGSAPAAEPAS